MRDILGVAIENDGIEFDPRGVSTALIRKPNESKGVRVHLEATLDSARIRLQIDIGVGDVVTPPALAATLHPSSRSVLSS